MSVCLFRSMDSYQVQFCEKIAGLVSVFKHVISGVSL